ncbi:TMP repeat superfamily protein [Desmospora sp. 8437]|nr:TMP repeat superfamily protein [Desmospora sp. 8437]
MAASVQANLGNFNEKIKGLSEAMDKAKTQLIAAAATAGGTISVVLGLSVAASPEVKEAFSKFDKSMKDFKKNVGEALAPAVVLVIDVLKTFVDIFNHLPGPIQTFLVLVLTLGTIMLGMVVYVASLASAFGALAAAEWSVLAPLLPIVAAVVAVIAIFALLVYAIVEAYNRVSWFRTAVDTVWSAIKEAFATALTFIKEIVQTVITAVTDFFQSKLEQIQQFWDKNGELIMAAVERVWGWIEPFISTVMGAVLGTIQIVWGWIQTFISGVMSIIQSIIQVAWTVIKTVTMSVWKGIQGGISTVITAIMDIIKAVAQLITGNWREAVNTLLSASESALKSMLQTFNNIFGGLPQKALTWGKNLMTGFINGFKSMFSYLKKAVGDAAKVVGDFLGFSSPTKRGPGRTSHRWAPNLMEMFSTGIRAGVPDVRMATREVVSTLAVVGEGGAAPVTGGGNVPEYVMVQIDLDKRQLAQVLAKPTAQLHNRTNRRHATAMGVSF